MKVLVIISLLGLSALARAAPLSQTIEEDPELTAGYFQGDMVLREHAMRNGLRSELNRWPDNIVYYKINDGYFDEEHRNYILQGMKLIEESTCIRFKEAAPAQAAYVNITGKADGCYSDIGYWGDVDVYNLQVYPLGEGCFRMGSIVHEFLHTLGFVHMQSTYNRDDYVRIIYENIQEGLEDQFVKYDEVDLNDFGVEYDYGSVLHYNGKSFSKNGESTIVPLQQGVQIGQRVGMSKSDILKVNLMYRCKKNNN